MAKEHWWPGKEGGEGTLVAWEGGWRRNIGGLGRRVAKVHWWPGKEGGEGTLVAWEGGWRRNIGGLISP